MAYLVGIETRFLRIAQRFLCRVQTHKHFQLDSRKIKRSQKALHAKTETEAIERALDFAIAEHEKNRLVLQASERFIKSGIEIKDVYWVFR